MTDVFLKVYRKIIGWKQAREDAENLTRVASDMRLAVQKADKIPVLIVCYNNGSYVANTLRQFASYGLHAIVIDNASSDAATIEVLTQAEQAGTAQVVYARQNYGNMVGFKPQIYECLPRLFAYTDPDLQYGPEMPPDFMDVLVGLTETYQVYKAGFALTLEHRGETASTDNRFTLNIQHPIRFTKSYSVSEWEGPYWLLKIQHPELDLYSAPIDTTFAVYNKDMYRGNYLFPSIRVGGGFSALHLPWFKAVDVMDDAERQAYLQNNRSATWRR